MTVDLVTIKIDRSTKKVTNKEIKKVRMVKKDGFYNPLARILGDEFLKHSGKEA